MAVTGGDPGDLPTDPDDINSRLAEIAAELTASAKFTEPSAAERARVPVRPARAPGAGIGPLQRPRIGPARAPGTSSGPAPRRRNRRLAAELRKPVQSASYRGSPGAGHPVRRRAARRSVGRMLTGWAYRRRSGRPEPVPDRGYATPSYRTPHQSLAILLAAMVILIALSFIVVSFLGRP